MNDQITIDKAKTEVNTRPSDVFSQAQVAGKEQEIKDNSTVQPPASGEPKASEVSEGQSEEVKSDESQKVVWQFKFRRYVCITNIIDEAAGLTPTGRKQKLTVKARNFRYPLDLSIPRDKKIHEYLLSSSQCGSEFFLLKKTDKNKNDLDDRAITLQKVLQMETEQIAGMLSAAELEQSGIEPGSKPTREQLIIAVIDNKKLTMGE